MLAKTNSESPDTEEKAAFKVFLVKIGNIPKYL